MKLNITMNIKANNDQEVQPIVTNTFMNLALNAGCMMACGGVNIDHVKDSMYKVTTTMEVDNASNVEKAAQKLTDNPNILNSLIVVTEDKSEAKQEPERAIAKHICHMCNNAYIEAENVVNPGKANEYYLCNECAEDACYEGTVEWCEECEHHVSDLIENPVTHKKNICPICGNTLWT